MAEAVLRADSLVVQGRVSRVSFEASPGATLALQGPNGSGKSTVLDAILGLVAYQGHLECSAQRLAVVPQRLEPPTALPLRVVDFLLLARSRWPVALGGGRRAARVEAVLSEAGLGHLARAQLAELSGGELRRVLLADAVDRRPELLLLDEPETGLDGGGRRWLDAVLEGLPGLGITTVLVSHDAGLVARHATASVELGALQDG
jgi:zinc transport system ATP-binding protein